MSEVRGIAPPFTSTPASNVMLGNCTPVTPPSHPHLPHLARCAEPIPASVSCPRHYHPYPYRLPHQPTADSLSPRPDGCLVILTQAFRVPPQKSICSTVVGLGANEASSRSNTTLSHEPARQPSPLDPVAPPLNWYRHLRIASNPATISGKITTFLPDIVFPKRDHYCFARPAKMTSRYGKSLSYCPSLSVLMLLQSLFL